MHENCRVISGPGLKPFPVRRVRVFDDYHAPVQPIAPPLYQPVLTPWGYRVSDADSLAFLHAQTALIKQQIYEIQYPDVDFMSIVPVTTEGTGWESVIQHFSEDIVGEMRPINEQTTELPLLQVTQTEFQVKVAAYGAAMKFNLEEVMQAAMIPGRNLRDKQQRAMRRVYDQTHWDLVLRGRSDIGWDGLINSNLPTAMDSPATGAGGSTYWKDKPAQEIILDINNLLEGVYVDSNTVEMADTLYLPPNVWAALASRVFAGTDKSIAKHIRDNNVYTLKTNRPLVIRELRGLENAAAGDTGRAIAFRNMADVLEYHLLLPLYILDEPQRHLFDWLIPAMTRTGGLEIKRPKAVRYLDLISE